MESLKKLSSFLKKNDFKTIRFLRNLSNDPSARRKFKKKYWKKWQKILSYSANSEYIYLANDIYQLRKMSIHD